MFLHIKKMIFTFVHLPRVKDLHSQEIWKLVSSLGTKLDPETIIVVVLGVSCWNLIFYTLSKLHRNNLWVIYFVQCKPAKVHIWLCNWFWWFWYIMQMIDDQDLGFFANFLGIFIFILVIAYHFVMADPKYEGN